MIAAYLIVCLVAFAALVALVRRDRASFGLPVAYLALLLLNHLPGAYAHMVDDAWLGQDRFTAIGIGYTALASTFFVLGVALVRFWLKPATATATADRRRFAVFCLLGGWLLFYGLSPLRGVPSMGAAIEKGSAIWVLGVILGLRIALQARDLRALVPWGGAMLLYPVLTLVSSGFISYGSAVLVTILAAILVSTRSHWRAVLGSVVVVFAALTLFVNYYANRDDMRAVVWSNAGVSQRIDANLGMFRNFKLLDTNDPRQLTALDQRLNQNVFIGIAETRLAGGQAEYLKGRSLSDAVLSLVPRAIWPSKPVYGGSPEIVAKMTGLRLNQSTSFGVGQVMELQVNFGAPGVIAGFLLIGALLGFLDTRAAEAERRGQLGTAIVLFLTGAALLQPIGSLVELSGGAAAAFVAGVFWRWVWLNNSTPARGATAPGDGHVAQRRTPT